MEFAQEAPRQVERYGNQSLFPVLLCLLYLYSCVVLVRPLLQIVQHSALYRLLHQSSQPSIITMSLPTAQLGRNGPQVSRLGFGLMGLSSFYGTPKPDEERLDVLTQAHKLGERFWDSSDL